ncbi:hypothetical protein Trydic_g8727 [Trypoxylus dichotomus]
MQGSMLGSLHFTLHSSSRSTEAVEEWRTNLFRIAASWSISADMRIRFFLWLSFALHFISVLCLIGKGSAHSAKWKKSLCRQHIFHKKCRELAMDRDLQKLEPLLEEPRIIK